MNSIFIKTVKSIRKRIDIPIGRLWQSARRQLLLSLTALVLAVSPLVGVLPVRAASVYDNVYRHTNDLIIPQDTYCPNMPATQDYATIYAQYFLDESKWHSSHQQPSSSMHAVKTAYLAALADENYGTWGVSKIKLYSQTIGYRIFWTQDSSAKLEWFHHSSGLDDLSLYGGGYVDVKCYHGIFSTATLDKFFGPTTAGAGGYAVQISTSGYPNYNYENLFLYSSNPNFDYNYPSGYEGDIIVDFVVDVDDDGLDLAQEGAQGTSDYTTDTDGDGLSDYVESVWYPDREDVFCDDSTPKVCAEPSPTVKDVYVEIDWMDDGTTAYKPNSTQIELVKDAFADKGIHLHIDTGEYGGGNELPVYIPALKFEPDINDTDFFNLKNGDNTYSAQFAEIRRGVWHYMITGNQVDDGGNNDTSGVAYPGDDDAFVALGLVASDHPLTADVAVAGTIIHELGHNLCLTDEDHDYTGQNAACVFDGVDHYAGNDYVSAMNYDKQFALVDYSEGLNPSGDHDDWSAIQIGMDDFVTLGEDPVEDALLRGGFGFDKQAIYN